MVAAAAVVSSSSTAVTSRSRVARAMLSAPSPQPADDVGGFGSQLVSDRVTLVNTMTNSALDRAGVKVKFDVYPEQIVDYLALVGDFLGNVLMRIQAEHGITVTIDDQVARDIADRCTADMSLGGRGVGQVLESAFVNPLARALVQVDGSTEVRVSDLLDRGGWIEVILQCG